MNRKLKLKTNEFISNSLRIESELRASDAVKETYSEEYESAGLEALCALDTYQQEVKSTMAYVLELELKILEDQIVRIFCKAVHSIVNAFSIINQTDVGDTLLLAYYAFDQYHVSLLKPTNMSLTAFYKLFKNVNKIIGDNEYSSNSISDDNGNRVCHMCSSYVQVILGLFIYPFDNFKKIKSDVELIEQLCKYADLTMKEETTKRATVDVQNTAPGLLTHQKILDIVQTEV